MHTEFYAYLGITLLLDGVIAEVLLSISTAIDIVPRGVELRIEVSNSLEVLDILLEPLPGIEGIPDDLKEEIFDYVRSLVSWPLNSDFASIYNEVAY